MDKKAKKSKDFAVEEEILIDEPVVVIEPLPVAGPKSPVKEPSIEPLPKKMAEPVVEEKPIQSVTMKVTDRLLLAAKGKDPFGNESPLKEKPTWLSSDPAIVTILPSEDGMAADLRPNGVGFATITFQGNGETVFFAHVDVTVVASLATDADIFIGKPEMKPNL